MPPVPTLITDLSTTAASNGPLGSESPASLDDYQRAQAAFIAQLYANTVEASTVIVASAATTNIGAAASNNVDISGTVPITGFDNVAEGINRKGRFTGVLPLTHNATSLILPGNANITTAANDRYEARSLGAGNWIVTKYVYASGNAISATTATIATNLTGTPSFFAPITASLTADVALNNTALYFDGPSVAQGTVGKWFVSGKVTIYGAGSGAQIFVKLWDGTTVIDSSFSSSSVATSFTAISLSGFIPSPTGNLRMTVKEANSASSTISFNASLNGKDSTITAFRIG